MFQVAKTLVMIEALLVAGLVFYRLALRDRRVAPIGPKAVALVLVTPAVGLFCGNAYVFYAYLACAIGFNARSRAELAAIYAVMMPLVPSLSLETSVGSVYLGPLSTIMAMNLGALIGFAWAAGRAVPSVGRYDWALVGLIVIFLYVYGREANATTFVRGLVIYGISYAGPFLLISRGIGGREDVERLVQGLILGAVLTAVTAVFQAYRHWLLYQTFYEVLRVEVPLQSWTLALRAGLIRTGGSMLDYSAAGVFLAAVLCVVPFAWRRFKPGFNWLVALVLVGGLVAAQSRGGWIAAILGLVFVMAYRRRYGVATLIVAVAGLGQAIALLVLKSGRLSSIVGASEAATGTVTYRKQLFNRGLDQIQAHPILGQTQAQLVANLPDMVQGQKIVDFVNAHLFIAMAAGLPLFAVWLAVWSSPIVQGWRLRASRAANADLAGVPAALLVPTMIAITATSIIDRNLVWPTIALGLAAPCFALARSDQAARRARPARLLSLSRSAGISPNA